MKDRKAEQLEESKEEGREKDRQIDRMTAKRDDLSSKIDSIRKDLASQQVNNASYLTALKETYTMAAFTDILEITVVS